LIATKRYYFGVGGGVDAFRRACGSQNDDKVHVQLQPQQEQDYQDDSSHHHHHVRRRLHVETAQVYDNGTGNIRELLKVRLLVDEDLGTSS
jgi:hypothetical protein